MTNAITNTSPLVYLFRAQALDWLPLIFTNIFTTQSVVLELAEGRRRGYDVPDPSDYAWLQMTDPQSLPSEWFSLDLGMGEMSSMALALEHPEYVLLLDDSLARQIAKAAGLQVWGTLRVLIEAKNRGLVSTIKPTLDKLQTSGMWISPDIAQRILILADEG